jgi:hypothetical protein
MVEFARIWPDMPKIVFSRTLQRADWNTTIVRHLVADEIIELKAQPGEDLALGGADLAAAFMRHDLIDEYRLYIHPIVIGQGKPLLPASDAKINLQLAQTRTFGNGVVLLATSALTLRVGKRGLPVSSAPTGTPGLREALPASPATHASRTVTQHHHLAVAACSR